MVDKEALENPSTTHKLELAFRQPVRVLSSTVLYSYVHYRTVVQYITTVQSSSGTLLVGLFVSVALSAF